MDITKWMIKMSDNNSNEILLNQYISEDPFMHTKYELIEFNGVSRQYFVTIR